VRSGKLVALAVTTPYRSKALPEVPTMQEAGLADYAVESWQGFVVPASTPSALVERTFSVAAASVISMASTWPPSTSSVAGPPPG
ncbi:tripartite tricarboxylate transporter substrate-binding protein, partial [Escherichia coli]|uniref:tripartite tricarboxylate transporter substrate-binding protein n=1 Tax=Escherichia coli TaxID=562 RepID=UPI003BA223FC